MDAVAAKRTPEQSSWDTNSKTGSDGADYIFHDEVELEGSLYRQRVNSVSFGVQHLSGVSEPADAKFLTAPVNQGLNATAALSVWFKFCLNGKDTHFGQTSHLSRTGTLRAGRQWKSSS